MPAAAWSQVINTRVNLLTILEHNSQEWLQIERTMQYQFCHELAVVSAHLDSMDICHLKVMEYWNLAGTSMKTDKSTITTWWWALPFQMNPREAALHAINAAVDKLGPGAIDYLLVDGNAEPEVPDIEVESECLSHTQPNHCAPNVVGLQCR